MKAGRGHKFLFCAVDFGWLLFNNVGFTLKPSKCEISEPKWGETKEGRGIAQSRTAEMLLSGWFFFPISVTENSRDDEVFLDDYHSLCEEDTFFGRVHMIGRIRGDKQIAAAVRTAASHDGH